MCLIRRARLFSKDFVVAGLQGSRFQLAQTLDLDRECSLQLSCFLIGAIPSSVLVKTKLGQVLTTLTKHISELQYMPLRRDTDSLRWTPSFGHKIGRP